MAQIIVMVDELRRWPHGRGVFRGVSCHLTVNGGTPAHLEALHALATWALVAGVVFVPMREQARARLAVRRAAW